MAPSIAGALGKARVATGRAAAALPGVSRLAEAKRRQRSANVIRRSGLFDERWYRRQAGGLGDGDDPVEHYLEIGASQGHSPHPLFDPVHYLAGSPKARQSLADPFTEFLERGCRRGDDPHVLFDTEAYLEQAPEALAHRYGAFGHYLEVGARRGLWPSRDLHGLPPADEGEDPFVAAVTAALLEQADVPDLRGFEYSFEEFDHGAADAFVRRMRDVAATLTERPLVSVVLPTKDRADVLPAAIDSVLGQSWQHLELIVVDDGGADGTGDLVATYEDPRIRYVHQANQGVSGARNRGIREARGELIAYLDSDNTWVPEFLEVMVAFLRSEGLRAAYSASELRGGDRVEYRGQPLDLVALRRQNYIDCIVLVHEASLLEETGPFDEQLRRVVDWDLLLRIAEATPVGYAPFVGTSYDVWEERQDRITRHESRGYRWVVRNKHLVDWAKAPEVAPGRLSIVLTARRPLDVVIDRLRQLDAVLADVDHEVLVVDRGLDEPQTLRLRVVAHMLDGVQVLSLGERFAIPVARNLGAASATGDVLVFADPAARFDDDGPARLARAVRATGRGVVQPTVLYPDGTVRSTGQVLASGTRAVTVGTGLPGGDLALLAAFERDGPDGLALAVDAATLRELEGFDPLFVRGAGDLDLGIRATQAGASVRWTPEVEVVASNRDISDAWTPSRDDRREFLRRWGGRALRQPSPGHDGLEVAELAPMAGESRVRPARWVAVLRPSVSDERARRWAIKLPVDEHGDGLLAPRARLLARALCDLGQHAVVDEPRAWYRATCTLDDIDLVLIGGQAPFLPSPYRMAVGWLPEPPLEVLWDEPVTYDRLASPAPGCTEQLRSCFPAAPLVDLGALPDGDDGADAFAARARQLLAAVEEAERQ